MSSHYTYLNFLTENTDLQKFITALALGGGLAFVAKLGSARLVKLGGAESAIVPPERGTFVSILDLVVESFVKFQDSILGKENRKYLPFTGSIFFFIFLSNLLGLVPGLPAITATVWVNLAIAIIVFFYFNLEGIKANGVLGYLKHFCGPLILIAPLLFCIEVFSLFLRVLTLNLRLYWNISADHIVLEIFHGMLDFPYSILVFPLYALGTFVAFMQAFIFTTLTMVYILLASQHEEEHAHH